jgi:2-isopropylmalate synthase
VKKIIHRKVVLEEFLIQAITHGSDDLGKVHMQVKFEDNIFHGFGANTDIITASVEAFLDAINKIPGGNKAKSE